VGCQQNCSEQDVPGPSPVLPSSLKGPCQPSADLTGVWLMQREVQTAGCISYEDNLPFRLHLKATL